MHLYRFFKERAAAGTPMVLATVYETAGSTYSKAGGYMLIDGDGHFCGMLSGGCLEGDLVERARRVIESGSAQTATYELGADDELWGLGVGCDGTMHVLLQALSEENDYQPFAEMARVLDGGSPADVAIVVNSDSPEVNAGAAVIVRDGVRRNFDLDNAIAETIANAIGGAVNGSSMQVQTPAGLCDVLSTTILPAPSLLVLGAGLDSEPLVNIATELGWRCTVVDHRPGYIESRSYPEGASAVCSSANELSARLDLDQFDMAIVMSHHLVSDRSYLEQLSRSTVGYVGLLGPEGRRDRLLDELADRATGLRGRLHGPAGIRLGGRGPAAIALEIAAEMQQYLEECGQVARGVDIH